MDIRPDDLPDTDPYVVQIARAHMAHNNCCDARDGLMCPDCLKKAKISVSALYRLGVLTPPW